MHIVENKRKQANLGNFCRQIKRISRRPFGLYLMVYQCILCKRAVITMEFAGVYENLYLCEIVNNVV